MRLRRSLLFLVCALLANTAARPQAQAPVYGYQVINRYPHDTSAFTQGLVLEGGRLYESTGLNGSSTLREVDLVSGTVIRKIDVPAEYFAEGMTIFQGKVFQLTWQHHIGFIYDPATFNEIGEFSYWGEGWGLTHDDRHLIMSDGSHQIRFLNPSTFQVENVISVFDQGSAVTRLNELEYINGEIYANVWQTSLIVRINPVTGAVLGWIDLTGLLPAGTTADVLNGIAYEPNSGHLLVTGKLWPWLFEITLVGNSAPVAHNQSVSTAEDTSRTITLTASDADSTALTFGVVSNPAHGTLSGAPPNLTYTPAPNYSGADGFTFSASDGFAATNATVSIAITPVNDPPVAAADAHTLQSNTTLSVQAPGVLGNDSDVDGDALSATLVSSPAHGTLSLAADGSFTYTPAANYSGSDGFAYRARDSTTPSATATVSLTINGSGTPGLPAVSLSPASLGFGNQSIGTTSAARSVTLSNPGTAPLSIAGITIVGVNASDFARSTTCGSSLAAGASCSIGVTFTPTSTGQRRASVSLASNAAASPHTVALSGAGKKR